MVLFQSIKFEEGYIMKRERHIIESTYLYELYYFAGMYYVDFYNGKADGFETEAGARESIYYQTH